MTPPQRDTEHILRVLDQMGDDLREHRRETREDFRLVREDIASVRERQARRIGATSIVVFTLPVVVLLSGVVASIAMGQS